MRDRTLASIPQTVIQLVKFCIGFGKRNRFSITIYRYLLWCEAQRRKEKWNLKDNEPKSYS